MTLTFTSDDVTSNTERGFVAMFHFINSSREDIDNSKTFLEILRKRSKNRLKDSTNQKNHEFIVVTSQGLVRPAFESAEHLKEVDNKGEHITWMECKSSEINYYYYSNYLILLII